eukprot:3835080-Amphidinium_carterae.1
MLIHVTNRLVVLTRSDLSIRLSLGCGGGKGRRIEMILAPQGALLTKEREKQAHQVRFDEKKCSQNGESNGNARKGTLKHPRSRKVILHCSSWRVFWSFERMLSQLASAPDCSKQKGGIASRTHDDVSTRDSTCRDGGGCLFSIHNTSVGLSATEK